MSDTIESLELEISSNSKGAVSGIDALTQSLTKLANATKGVSGLKSIANQIQSIGNATKSVDPNAANNISGLARAIQLLGGVKISSSIANQLKTISTALQQANFSGANTKIQDLVSALAPLSSMPKNNLSSFVTSLKKLPDVFAELNKMDMAAFTLKIQELVTALQPLGDVMQKVANGFSAFPDKIQKLLASTNSLPTSNKRAASSFTDLFNKVRTGITVVSGAVQTIKSLVNKSSEYNEIVNRFSVSLGQYAKEAYDYAESVSGIMGIDTADWMNNQSIFMTLATGFGVASDRAHTMSTQLTQLGYDIASFNDLKIEDAMQKLQSGLAGELEPLRRIGYDLSQAKLEAVALELGIDKSVSSMTQAEKAQLRYYAIMTQVTTSHGDMARTLEEPANQMRVLKAQFEMAARAVGNIFMPAVQAILPYLIAVTTLVKELANSIATFVGFEMPEVDGNKNSLASAAETTSEAMGDASESAKKLKSHMLGIDELNVINPDSGGDADSSSALDFELPTYDFLSGATNEKIEGIKEKIKELVQPLVDLIDKTAEWGKALDFEPMKEGLSGVLSSVSSAITHIGEAFSWAYTEVLLPIAQWAIESGIPAVLEAISNALDAVTTASSAVHEGIEKIKPVLEPIVTWIGEVVIVIIEGLGSIFAKVADVFEEKGGTITSIITGIGEVVQVIWGILKPVLDVVVSYIKNHLAFVGDLLALKVGAIIDVISGIVEFLAGVFTGDWERAWGGISKIFESYWGYLKDYVKLVWDHIGDTLKLAWDGIVALFSSVGAWFYDVVIVPVGNFFKGLWETIAGFFSNLWDDIVEIWNTVATWFNDTVIQPLVNFFSPIVETISQIFSGCWLIIQAVWLVVSTWFNENVITPVVSFFEELWTAVSGFFAQLWTDIKAIWKTVSTWFNEKVITPVVDFFRPIVESITAFFSQLWEDIKAIWSTVSTWFSENIIEPVKTAFQTACNSIGEFFSSLWLGIKKGVASAMNTVISGIESAINRVVRGINKLISGFNEVVQWAADVVGVSWGGVTLLNEVTLARISVPEYAMGGFPEQGQMFIAREAGAEMVGSIGRRTAVANNDQIVAGIAGGVAEANAEQNALLREQNALLSALLEKESGVYLDGKNLTRSVEKYQRERGRVLITGGVV